MVKSNFCVGGEGVTFFKNQTEVYNVYIDEIELSICFGSLRSTKMNLLGRFQFTDDEIK